LARTTDISSNGKLIGEGWAWADWGCWKGGMDLEIG
jgi:hypothetical protein